MRLHDCNWPHPDVVDIPTNFPLFHLDADDPKNYQFAKTDAYIKPIIENGATLLFRMGVTIEHKAPRFHVDPPEDFKKWTKICINILGITTTVGLTVITTRSAMWKSGMRRQAN